MKTALICGVSGQDGSFLARDLVKRGYSVFGSSRDAENNNFSNLLKLRIRNEINFISMDPKDFSSVFNALKRAEPEEVYFLSSQSSVGLSFEQPAETIASCVSGTLNFLEACRVFNPRIKLYFACSSECFGNTPDFPANESTSFNPLSPYAVAKASSFWLVRSYREAYGLFAVSGILFNHESPFRPSRFVTQKVAGAVRRISEGSDERLMLGRLDIFRDWGWAPDYVKAMWLMMQNDSPRDYVIASGESHSLKEFVEIAFACRGLDYRDRVVFDDHIIRPADISYSVGDPTKAYSDFGWKSKTKFEEIVSNMVEGVW